MLGSNLKAGLLNFGMSEGLVPKSLQGFSLVNSHGMKAREPGVELGPSPPLSTPTDLQRLAASAALAFED